MHSRTTIKYNARTFWKRHTSGTRYTNRIYHRGYNNVSTVDICSYRLGHMHLYMMTQTHTHTYTRARANTLAHNRRHTK